MLETVSSRRLYGFLVLTVLPGSSRSSLPHFRANPVPAASFGVGYYLKDRKDSQVSLATATKPAEAPVVAIEERIRMLRRKDAEIGRAVV